MTTPSYASITRHNVVRRFRSLYRFYNVFSRLPDEIRSEVSSYLFSNTSEEQLYEYTKACLRETVGHWRPVRLASTIIQPSQYIEPKIIQTTQYDENIEPPTVPVKPRSRPLQRRATKPRYRPRKVDRLLTKQRDLDRALKYMDDGYSSEDGWEYDEWEDHPWEERSVLSDWSQPWSTNWSQPWSTNW